MSPTGSSDSRMALWGGLECTMNRVGETYFDQSIKSGHTGRLTDWALFASLGVEKVRAPFLWERAVVNDEPGHYDWTDFEIRLAEMKRVGITPIAGLLHHGSGPRFTSLVDIEFPQKLAAYARAFVEKFPEIEDYTPVNEPLTTARFSCLYGVWYPHLKDDKSFVRALFNQCEGTRLAMKAIREVNPRARLIQTDDMGRATGTEPLKNQIRFENLRRWLTFDFLTGRVNETHPLFGWLCDHGMGELNWQGMANEPCPPDIIGLNHYLLSNRYLDHRINLYPDHLHGSNGYLTYADVGAVDSGHAEPPTPASIFRETWERYKIPLAVTEAHLAGFREQQMRWFQQIWNAAVQLRAEGVDFRAVTAWSLLGSFDWTNLCTRDGESYETGIFDVRAGTPRPTAMVPLLSAASRGELLDHPVLEQPGWWHTPRRMIFAHSGEQIPHEIPTKRPILITGTGTLGRAFARLCHYRGLGHRHVGRQELDIADAATVRQMLIETKPWAVINTAGYVKVDQAQSEPERCHRDNVVGPTVLAIECAALGIPFVTFSSDMVFDGKLSRPYVESDAVNPLNVYGETKAESERQVLEHQPNSLIVRTSSFFGPWDESNFVTQTLRRLARGEVVPTLSDVHVSPTYVPDLVHACLDLLIDGTRGIVHLTNTGSVTWTDFARRVAKASPQFERAAELIKECSQAEMNLPALRPRFSALASERAPILSSLEDALSRYLAQIEVPLTPSQNSSSNLDEGKTA